MTLAASNLSWSAGGRSILDRVSLTVADGAMVGIIGPNGSGKSSLIRCLAGLRAPSDGAVSLDGVDLRAMRRKDIARRLALIDQHASTDLDLTVEDVVSLGRIPHRDAFAGANVEDERIVAGAIARVDLQGWEARRWGTLSGGEQQRVQIARALAQQPHELLLDEPTNHLDLRHQLGLLALIRQFRMTTVIVLHDLNLAVAYCDELVVLHEGRIVAKGPPAHVVTRELLRDVYGVECAIERQPGEERPWIRLLSLASDSRAQRSSSGGNGRSSDSSDAEPAEPNGKHPS